MQHLHKLPTPGQNDRHFADDIFSYIFVNEMFSILVKISLKFVPKNPNSNNPALVQIMAWLRINDKPLSEPMLTWFTDAYMRQGRWAKLNVSTYPVIVIASWLLLSGLYQSGIWLKYSKLKLNFYGTWWFDCMYLKCVFTVVSLEKNMSSCAFVRAH